MDIEEYNEIFVSDVKHFLNKIDSQSKKNMKISAAHQLYEYLCNHIHEWYALTNSDLHADFVETARRKLIELYYKSNWKASEIYYNRLFPYHVHRFPQYPFRKKEPTFGWQTRQFKRFCLKLSSV